MDKNHIDQASGKLFNRIITIFRAQLTLLSDQKANCLTVLSFT